MKAETFKDWWRRHRSWRLLRVRQTYSDIYAWYRPGRYDVTGLLPDLWYYIACRFWRKWNTVTAKTLQPTWVDRDELLLHTSFAILCEVVEKEDYLNHVAYQDYHCDIIQEIAQLYDWWTVLRPQRIERWELSHTLERLADDGQLVVSTKQFTLWNTVWKNSRQYHAILSMGSKMEFAQDEEDDRMLHRLIEIRRCLWT